MDTSGAAAPAAPAGPRDLRDLAVAQSSKMPVRDPRTGIQLIFGDKTPAFIEVAAPDSDRYMRTWYEIQDENRKADFISQKKFDEDEVRLAANSTISWNLMLDGQSVPCTIDDAKRLYSSSEFAFLRIQVRAWQVMRANFMQPLPEISDTTQNDVAKAA